MTHDDEAYRKKCGPTLEATTRSDALSSKQLLRDDKVEKLMFDLYYSARVGLAAAEYNLEKAGLIEMIHGHRAGQMSTDGTDSMARLEKVMLRDPPLEVAEQDAEEEANDVATDCGCEVDDPWLAVHRRILVNLDERAERIYRMSANANIRKRTRHGS
jgi:hypothetical protein